MQYYCTKDTRLDLERSDYDSHSKESLTRSPSTAFPGVSYGMSHPLIRAVYLCASKSAVIQQLLYAESFPVSNLNRKHWKSLDALVGFRRCRRVCRSSMLPSGAQACGASFLHTMLSICLSTSCYLSSERFPSLRVSSPGVPLISECCGSYS